MQIFICTTCIHRSQTTFMHIPQLINMYLGIYDFHERHIKDVTVNMFTLRRKDGSDFLSGFTRSWWLQDTLYVGSYPLSIVKALFLIFSIFRSQYSLLCESALKLKSQMNFVMYAFLHDWTTVYLNYELLSKKMGSRTLGEVSLFHHSLMPRRVAGLVVLETLYIIYHCRNVIQIYDKGN